MDEHQDKKPIPVSKKYKVMSALNMAMVALSEGRYYTAEAAAAIAQRILMRMTKNEVSDE